MAWWQSDQFAADLNEALSHLNEAADASRAVRATRICELYFHALNKLWNAFARHEGEPGRADTPSFIALLKSMSGDSRSSLLNNRSPKDLVDLTPEVLDHSILKSRGYRPGEAITDPLRRDATEKHRKLRSAHRAFFEQKGDTTTDSILKKLAEFLFVVRSNIAHGEKTPYGPDLEKARRDEEISGLVIPLQKVIIDLLLDRPSQKLVAYGTIRPGGQNEHILKDVEGHWQPCFVRGTLREHDLLSFFRWDPHASRIQAMLLTAPSLINSWERLDRFEGDRYKRHLVPIEASGARFVANLFEERTPTG
jgi:gamma-glutamylcyclotransferase (GGCT)/AIG2-like uncharacterized protein YtfP